MDIAQQLKKEIADLSQEVGRLEARLGQIEIERDRRAAALRALQGESTGVARAPRAPRKDADYFRNRTTQAREEETLAVIRERVDGPFTKQDLEGLLPYSADQIGYYVEGLVGRGVLAKTGDKRGRSHLFELVAGVRSAPTPKAEEKPEKPADAQRRPRERKAPETESRLADFLAKVKRLPQPFTINDLEAGLDLPVNKRAKRYLVELLVERGDLHQLVKMRDRQALYALSEVAERVPAAQAPKPAAKQAPKQAPALPKPSEKKLPDLGNPIHRHRAKEIVQVLRRAGPEGMIGSDIARELDQPQWLVSGLVRALRAERPPVVEFVDPATPEEKDGKAKPVRLRKRHETRVKPGEGVLPGRTKEGGV